VTSTLDGIRTCLDARYLLQQRLAEIAQEIKRMMDEQAKPLIDVDFGGEDRGADQELVLCTDFHFPVEIASPEQLDRLIERLTALKAQFASYTKIVFKT